MAEKKNIAWFYNTNADIHTQFAHFLEVRSNVRPRYEALKILITYCVTGGLWVLLSDRLLAEIMPDPVLFQKAQLYKGWIFVGISGLVYFFIILNSLNLFKAAVDKIFEGYQSLTSSHEELMVMDEELTQQFEELETHRNALMVSDQRYRLAVEGSNDGIWDWDFESDTYFFSLKWKAAFGYQDDDLPNSIQTWKSLLHPDDQARSQEYLDRYLATKEGFYQNTYRLRCKNGQYRWILSRGKGVWDISGKPVRLAGSHTDITEQIRLQEFLRSQTELSENIIDDSPIMVLILDPNGTIFRINPFAEYVTGYSKEEALGINLIDLLMPKDSSNEMYQFLESLRTGKYLGSTEIEIACKNGSCSSILWSGNTLHREDGKLQGAVLIGLDITDRRYMEDRLHQLAYHDSLTKLPNRTLLEETAQRAINLAERDGSMMAFIYLDIDNFKHINDSMGHSAGDQLIIHLGEILSREIQQPNMVARLGGDEYAILLTDVESRADVTERLSHLLKCMREPWWVNGNRFFITVSMGVAFYPQHGYDLSTLMQNADTALFHIKESTKDGYCLFTVEMREKTWQYIQMSNELGSAISNGEFQLYYQPQIELETQRVVGFEALIRWLHPQRGFIPPADFIPFAEKTGHIGRISSWVLDTALNQQRIWEQKGIPCMKMCINLSGLSLTQEGLVEEIERVLISHGENFCELEIEITETSFITNLERAMEVLQRLRALGISISLDDFGTGYSSLTYLQKLPIDILKIDREFLKNIRSHNEDSFIFKTIVELAHNLGLKVVAEGVETEEQLAYLRRTGCDIGQGYYFSRPLPANQVEHFFKEGALL